MNFIWRIEISNYIIRACLWGTFELLSESCYCQIQSLAVHIHIPFTWQYSLRTYYSQRNYEWITTYTHSAYTVHTSNLHIPKLLLSADLEALMSSNCVTHALLCSILLGVISVWQPCPHVQTQLCRSFHAQKLGVDIRSESMCVRGRKTALQ